MASIDSALVFEARIVSSAAPASRARKISCFRPRSSSAASTIELGFVGDVGQGVRLAHEFEAPGRPFVDRIGIELEPHGATFEAEPDGIPCAIDGRGVDVVEDDLGAGLERDLGDAGTHDAGPDDADRGDGPVSVGSAIRSRAELIARGELATGRVRP